MNIYREQLLDHYNNPRNFGQMADADKTVELENQNCGDRIKIYAKIADGKISKLSFDGEGCAIAIASASILTEHFIGKSLAELKGFDLTALQRLLQVELTVSRLKCANLGLEALKKASISID
jgi:nitrogen fixation NifU-like protein